MLQIVKMATSIIKKDKSPSSSDSSEELVTMAEHTDTETAIKSRDPSANPGGGVTQESAQRGEERARINREVLEAATFASLAGGKLLPNSREELSRKLADFAGIHIEGSTNLTPEDAKAIYADSGRLIAKLIKHPDMAGKELEDFLREVKDFVWTTTNLRKRRMEDRKKDQSPKPSPHPLNVEVKVVKETPAPVKKPRSRSTTRAGVWDDIDVRRRSPSLTSGHESDVDDVSNERFLQKLRNKTKPHRVRFEERPQTEAEQKLERSTRETWDRIMKEDRLAPYVEKWKEVVVDHNKPFFVAVVEEKDLLGRVTNAYHKVRNFEELWQLRKAAGISANISLIHREARREIIVPKKNTQWIMVESPGVEPGNRRFQVMASAIENVLMTPELIQIFHKDKSTTTLMQKGSTQEDPTEEDGVLRINVPWDDVETMENVTIGAKDKVLTQVDGIAIYRGQSGVTATFNPVSKEWLVLGTKDDPGWPFTSLTLAEDLDKHRKTLTGPEAARIVKMADDFLEEIRIMEKDAVDKAKLLQGAYEEIDQLKAELEDCRRKLHECPCNGGDGKDDTSSISDVGSTAGDILRPSDVTPEEAITNFSKALDIKVLEKSIVNWSMDKSATIPARAWVKSAIQHCRRAYLSDTIIPRYLLFKLQHAEATKMEDLEDDKWMDLPTFYSTFLEYFGKRTSPMAQLRALIKRQMSPEQVQKEAYYEFATKLMADAHEAYGALGIERNHWKTLDRIVVIVAFCGGIPTACAEHLLLKKVDTIRACHEEARTWAQAQADAKGRAGPPTVGGGQIQQNGQGGGSGGQRGRSRGKGRGGGGGSRWRQGQQSGAGQQTDQSQQQQEQPSQPPRQPTQQSQAGGTPTAPPTHPATNPPPGDGTWREGARDGRGQWQRDGSRRRFAGDKLCLNCRRLTPRPQECKHCRVCGQDTHMSYDCPNK